MSRARVGRIVGWTLVLAALAFVGLGILVPPLARRGGVYLGSYKHAHRWAKQLAACDSLADVKQRFNCIRINWITENSYKQVQVSDVGKRKASALVCSCPDGSWIACAYADSHGDPAGGTLVARDSEGVIRVFFGHICGKPIFVRGDTLEEVYAELSSCLTEVSLDKEEAIEPNAPRTTNHESAERRRREQNWRAA